MDFFRTFGLLSTLALGLWLGTFLEDRWGKDQHPTGGIDTALSISHELRCEEDADIVVTLGTNGLPFGFCQQVIER